MPTPLYQPPSGPPYVYPPADTGKAVIVQPNGTLVPSAVVAPANAIDPNLIWRQLPDGQAPYSSKLQRSVQDKPFEAPGTGTANAGAIITSAAEQNIGNLGNFPAKYRLDTPIVVPEAGSPIIQGCGQATDANGVPTQTHLLLPASSRLNAIVASDAAVITAGWRVKDVCITGENIGVGLNCKASNVPTIEPVWCNVTARELDTCYDVSNTYLAYMSDCNAYASKVGVTSSSFRNAGQATIADGALTLSDGTKAPLLQLGTKWQAASGPGTGTVPGALLGSGSVGYVVNLSPLEVSTTPNGEPETPAGWAGTFYLIPANEFGARHCEWFFDWRGVVSNNGQGMVFGNARVTVREKLIQSNGVGVTIKPDVLDTQAQGPYVFESIYNDDPGPSVDLNVVTPVLDSYLFDTTIGTRITGELRNHSMQGGVRFKWSDTVPNAGGDCFEFTRCCGQTIIWTIPPTWRSTIINGPSLMGPICDYGVGTMINGVDRKTLPGYLDADSGITAPGDILTAWAQSQNGQMTTTVTGNMPVVTSGGKKLVQLGNTEGWWISGSNEYSGLENPNMQCMMLLDLEFLSLTNPAVLWTCIHRDGTGEFGGGGYSLVLVPEAGKVKMVWRTDAPAGADEKECSVLVPYNVRQQLGFISAIGTSGNRIGMIVGPSGKLASVNFNLSTPFLAPNEWKLGFVSDIGTGSTFQANLRRTWWDRKDKSYLGLGQYYDWAQRWTEFAKALG